MQVYRVGVTQYKLFYFIKGTLYKKHFKALYKKQFSVSKAEECQIVWPMLDEAEWIDR